MIKEQSDIVGYAEVQMTAKVLISVTVCISARQYKQLWNAPAGSCYKQSFSVCITYFLSNKFRYFSLYEKGKAHLLPPRPKKGHGQSCRMDMNITCLWAEWEQVCGKEVVGYTSVADLRNLAARPPGKGTFVLYNDRYLMFPYFCHQLNPTLTLGKSSGRLQGRSLRNGWSTSMGYS